MTMMMFNDDVLDWSTELGGWLRIFFFFFEREEKKRWIGIMFISKKPKPKANVLCDKKIKLIWIHFRNLQVMTLW